MFIKFPLKPDDQQLIETYNQTEEAITPTTLDRLFSDQAVRFGERVAVEYQEESMTYRELHEKSNQVAAYLKNRNISNNHLVGVLAERCIETIVMILGVLKAGAAYVPIDREYPEERRNYILLNSDCRLLLDRNFYKKKGIDQLSTAEHEPVSQRDDMAYVMYTSGSTGRPKGVVITHRAVTNTILDMNRKFNVNEQDKFLGVSSMSFDLSVYDIFGAFASGARLVIAPDQRDIKKLYQLIQNKGITIWNSVPAILDLVTDYAANHRPTAAAEEPAIQPETATGNTSTPADKAASMVETMTYYWSPAAHWSITGTVLQIAHTPFENHEHVLFPDFYYLAQAGITLDDLTRHFPLHHPEKLQQFFRQLVDQHVLVSELLPVQEVFYPHHELYKKLSQKSSQPHESGYELTIPLKPTTVYPASITNRKSHRHFSQTTPIPFHDFSHMLSVLKRKGTGRDDSYHYASAGGLYPIETYVYVKEGRVEDVPEGLYHYDPVSGELGLVQKEANITAYHYSNVNRSLFNESAFSIYLIYNADVNMPKYGVQGYLYAAIETGMMTTTICQVAETIGIGTCSIGELSFEEIKPAFDLKPNQLFLHAIEGGLIPSSGFPATKQAVEQPSQATAPSPVPASEAQPVGTSTLRLILLSGDWIPLTLPQAAKKQFTKAQVISLGGATEASIWSIYYPIEEVKEEWTSIPYGMPLANQTFYVLNYELDLCPVGVRGELYIGGVGLAQGYFKDEEKTNHAFITHPKYGRLYRTGDHGIMRKEGYIEFMGRVDHQVKIRGYRIELGEIEHNLLDHEAVKTAVILDKTDANGKKYICAYYIPHQEVSTNELREHLQKRIPMYMIPSYFVPIDHIPLTPNGKVDRNALPEPQEDASVTSSYQEATTQLEKMLTGIWEELLQVQNIGVHDDFFELGGHSLIAIKMQVEIEKVLHLENLEIHIKIYEYPTIQKLAAFIEQHQKR
ncbi:AMP-binding protein [Brevibacillus dissolubilis]|uniref:AMP-binding protein n=1 Tax=Brevibacillus dissolubilis TaxID=1844116 RepID=UPI001116C6BC|nr:AMP-binding protein [Brevibacillus dissolubilis]